MDDRQRNKMNMYLVVRGYLQDNQAVWSVIPKFVSAEADFNTELTNVESLSQAQQQPLTGVTVDKQQLKTAVADAAMPLVGGLRALAADVSNNDLAAQAGFTRSDFLYEPDTESADNADIIHNLASQNAAGLVDFGIAQAQIDALDAAIVAYRASIGAPRQVIVGTSTATSQIAASITALDGLLTKMDNLCEVLRPANPAFYTGYHNARKIIDLGSGGAPPPPPPPPPPGPPSG